MTPQYLAGLFDGEGGFYANYRCDGQFPIRANIASTCKEVLEMCKDFVGVGSIYEQSGTNKPCYNWSCNQYDVLKVLDVIEDHLIIKKDQAKLIRLMIGTLYNKALDPTEKRRRELLRGKLLEVWETTRRKDYSVRSEYALQ